MASQPSDLPRQTIHVPCCSFLKGDTPKAESFLFVCDTGRDKTYLTSKYIASNKAAVNNVMRGIFKRDEDANQERGFKPMGVIYAVRHESKMMTPSNPKLREHVYAVTLVSLGPCMLNLSGFEVFYDDGRDDDFRPIGSDDSFLTYNVAAGVIRRENIQFFLLLIPAKKKPHSHFFLMDFTPGGQASKSTQVYVL